MSTIQKLLDPQKIVDLTVADIVRRVRYSGLVTRISGEQFKGATGTDGKPTVYYETEGVTVARDYEFRTRTKPIEFDDIFRTSLPIKIDKHITQGVRTTPEQEYFDEVRYATDVLPPATTAVATKLNAKIETALLGASNLKVTDLALVATGDANGASALRQALTLKARCDAMGMPKQGRKILAGADAFVWLAASEATLKYDLAQANSLYRRGVFGIIAGFEVVDGTDLLDEDAFVVLHPSWAVMPSSAGELPDSNVTWARRASIEGFEARVQRGYSLDWDRNGQVIHTYWNISQIDDEISRHTRASAASAADGSEAGDPIITADEVVKTGKNVRIAKGTFTPAA